MEFAQTYRPIKVTTPLGEDQFILTSLSGSEYISGLFQFQLTTVWQGSSPVVFKDILGKSVTAEVENDGIKRYMNGIVKSITQGARVPQHDLTWYYMTIVPTAWLLTRKVNCRIFQKMKAPDIIQQVLAEAGVAVDLKLQRGYIKRDYCVQYYETDFAFVSRLMEFEGICYFFTHEEGSHTMVLSDDKSNFSDLPHGADVTFEEIVGGLRVEGRIYNWQKAQEINSGKFSLNDFNFETPDANMLAQAATSVNLDKNAALEIYQNPGDYLTQSVGDNFAEIRMKEEEMRAQVVRGKSFNDDLRPGYKFNLQSHFADKGYFAVTGVTHSATQPLDTDFGQGEGFTYENQFTCISFDTQYQPARVTPLPSIRGVQTAEVVGPKGEEIYTDEYGRVKVQFHWDREGKHDENSSCWIRVATYWAGKKWGAIHIPRIGQEVVVDFVEGDVDRPLIVGSVYNADQMPPYTLPHEQTKSTLKSNSSKSGGGGFNELRFEDKTKSEEVYFHAQKDLNSVIENNETRKVGYSAADDGSRTTEIYNNETLSVTKGNQKTTVEKGNQSTEIQKGNQTTNVLTGSITTEAMQSITLKVGANSIVINQQGITLNALMITIQGQVQVQVTAPMTTVTGSGMMKVTGGMVMIN